MHKTQIWKKAASLGLALALCCGWLAVLGLGLPVRAKAATAITAAQADASTAESPIAITLGSFPLNLSDVANSTGKAVYLRAAADISYVGVGTPGLDVPAGVTVYLDIADGVTVSLTGDLHKSGIHVPATVALNVTTGAGSTLNATGGSASGIGADSNEYSFGDIELGGSGTVVAGGAAGIGAGGAGTGTVRVTGGTVQATGDDGGIGAQSLAVSGAGTRVAATGSSGSGATLSALAVGAGATLEATGNNSGLYGYSMTISGEGAIVAAGTGADGCGTLMDTLTLDFGGSLTVTGTIKGIGAGNLVFTRMPASLSVDGGNGPAIYGSGANPQPTTITWPAGVPDTEKYNGTAATYVHPATVPGAPTGLAATPGDGQLALSWTAPANDGSSVITGYKVSTDNGTTWTATNSTDTSYTVTGLTNGSSYTVCVRAVNAVGDGAVSGSITARPAAPPAISGPTAMTLTAGYAATATGAFTITGTAPVTVTPSDARFTWDSANNKLNIPAGLGAGSYPVRLTATGAVLPDAVLDFTLTVQPAPRQPTLANAANNAVSLPSGGVTAGTTFTFTATGDRQSAAGAVVGDTRFVPASWGANPSGAFPAGGPYSAMATITTAGSHTLTVTFRQQQWSGTAWENTDITDQKSVTFDVKAAGGSSSQSGGSSQATGSPAPQTGDGSNLMVWLILCALALAGLGGVFVWRVRVTRQKR